MPRPVQSHLMLRSRKQQPESKQQKLFNLVVSQYLNTPQIEQHNNSDYCKAFLIPEDLVESAASVNLRILSGTLYATFRPIEVFSSVALAKLTLLKEQTTEIKQQIALKRQELDLQSNAEIISAHKTYMNRLHAYNESKDSAQALLGKLAQLTGTTTKELYPKFDLCIDD